MVKKLKTILTILPLIPFLSFGQLSFDVGITNNLMGMASVNYSISLPKNIVTETTFRLLIGSQLGYVTSQTLGYRLQKQKLDISFGAFYHQYRVPNKYENYKVLPGASLKWRHRTLVGGAIWDGRQLGFLFGISVPKKRLTQCGTYLWDY